MHQASGVEAAVRQAAAAAERVEAYEMRQERYRNEETPQRISELVEEGHISLEEAQRRAARMHMHEKQDEKQLTGRPSLDEAAAAAADYKTNQQLLEDVLDQESKYRLIRLLKDSTGFRVIERAVKKEQHRRKAPFFEHPFPLLNRVVGSPAFECVLGVILTFNGILIGIQTSIAGTSAEDDTQFYFIMEQFFTTVFVFEVILRFLVDGWTWIWNFMNFCDFMLIFVTGVLPMWLFYPLGIESDAVRVFQVLRILRLVRLVRMVRTVKFFRIFWQLISGILDNGHTLFWTYVMISAVLYVFAIFGVHLIGKAEVFEDNELVSEYFGDVPKTLVTLLQLATLDSWSSIARPLMKKSRMVCPYFICAILVVTLALLNLITAVIVNNAFDSRAKDDELRAKEAREACMAEINDLKKLFLDIDTDGSGMLSKEEYDDALKNDEKIVQKFEILQILPAEREEIWQLLDMGEGEVSMERFAAGLRDLQGDARAKDSFTIVKKIEHLNKRVDILSESLRDRQVLADALRAEVAEAHRQMGGVMVELRDLISYLSHCVPPEPAPRQKRQIDGLQERLQHKRKMVEAQDIKPKTPQRAPMPVKRVAELQVALSAFTGGS